MGTYTYTGTAAADLIQLATFSSQPSNNSIYNIDGGAGIDTLALNNTGYAKANTKFLSTKFTIAPVNASGVIVVSGASSGGTLLTFNLTRVEKITFSDGITVSLASADTTAPVFTSAAVNGSSLVMTYTDANNLDATNIPATTAFTVSGNGNHVVSAVVVDAALKTVTLTLATPVAYGEVVTVAYTDPTSGNDIKAVQDVAGNDAVTLPATAVTNNTPDTTPPLFGSAVVNGATMVLTYTDANNLDAAHPPPIGAFAVSGGHTVSGVSVDAAAKTVTLTLGTAVVNGEVVTVSYTDPTSGNDANAVQDVVGNDAVSLAAKAVTNNTPDTTAPLFSSASVSGSTLVLTYTDINNLDAANPPFANAFAVSGGHTVSGVSVDAVAKTVTLTLGTAVVNGEVVTVSYTDPTSGNDINAVQDVAGNDAVSLAARAVTNNTPDTTAPLFSSASVNGSTLVLTYTDINNLDAANPPLANAFAVSGGHTVSGVSVDAVAKTVTLTLGTAVVNGEVVTVSYTDPTSGNDANAVQDVAGNDAVSLAARAVTNITPIPGDTTPPLLSSVEVNGTMMVLTYTDVNNLDNTHPPSTSSFAVSGGHTVSGVSVDAAAKTVTLTLGTAVVNGEVVTVSYTDPTSGNDINAVQDVAGNDAVSLVATAVMNNTPDTTAPLFSAASVNGSSLVMTYTDVNNLDNTHPPSTSSFAVSGGHTVSGVSVDAAAKTVTLTLGTAVVNGEVVTVSYTDPTSGNDANAVQDVSGNDAVTLPATAVTNNTPDTTAPLFSSAVVNGSTLVLSYTDTNNLDSVHLPPSSAFAVSGGHGVNSVSVDAVAKTVTLTLSTPVANGEVVTVAYTDPTANNDVNALQDLAGNDAVSLAATAVTNNTLDIIAPLFSSAAVNGSTLVLSYTDANNLDAVNLPPSGAFAVSGGHTVSRVSVDAAAKTVTLTLGTAVINGEVVTVSYTDPTSGNDANAVQDVAGNDAVSLAAAEVTNNTPDTTAPLFSEASVNGSSLVMTYIDVNNLDSTHTPSPSLFTVSGHTVAGVSVDAAAKTVTLTLGTAVVNGEVVTVSYTDPTSGNDANAVQDFAGNDAASLVSKAVTNNTPDTTPPVFASALVNGSKLVLTYTDTNNLDAAHTLAVNAFTVSGHTVTTVAVDASAKTVTLTLNTSVTHNEVVTVTYTDPLNNNAIQDLAGNHAASLTMPVGPDTEAPTVFSFSPLDNSAGVAVGSDFVLTFSEPIQKGTGLIEIHSGTETGALVASYDAATSTNLTISGTMLTINPSADLAPGTHYFITLADGSINDYAGNHFAGTTAYDFTTADPYVANGSSGGAGIGVAIAGVGGLGVLAWLLF